jgi:enamine deaminase RidA (YjgF/YER057c/UK114 family)
VVGSGDVAAQVEQIFENATRSLALLGMDLSNVVRTFETVRPEALGGYKYTGRVRREHLGPVYPAAAGIVQRRVASSDDVLIAYDFVAYAGDVEAVNPGWERYAKLTYSPAVRAGDLLFMSGQAALDPTTERAVYAGDIGEQARYTYENVAEVLAAAGLKPRNLIKTIEFVTPQGLRGYRSVSGVRQAILEEPWPASTGALCHSLLRPEFEIEIIPTAMAFEED